MDKSYEILDNNLEEDSLKEEAWILAQLENDLSNDDDGGEMPPSSIAMAALTRS
jgi:hypothetical protein